MGLIRGTLPAYIVWEIWESRCKFRFKEGRLSAFDIVKRINSALHESMIKLKLKITRNNNFSDLISLQVLQLVKQSNVPPAILMRFLREHRSEWVDSNIDAYSDATIKAGPCILPFLEVIKLENIGHCPEDSIMSRDMFLLQVCSGMDDNSVGTCAKLIFEPIDSTFADDAPLLPSGFRILHVNFTVETVIAICTVTLVFDGIMGKVVVNIPLILPSDLLRTFELASTLEIEPTGNREAGDNSGNCASMRFDMTLAFQFAFESHLQENVASMARQYICSIISFVQRVVQALSPSLLNSHSDLQVPAGSHESHTLTRWIFHSYRCYFGVDLLKPTGEGSESIFNTLWHNSDAIMCYFLKAIAEKGRQFLVAKSLLRIVNLLFLLLGKRLVKKYATVDI
ncbi:hypothetical protein GIB67_039749 [Kingdonia uniflora]|uniref:MEKHLA domain-containing protein n=1 Tax=Kingdonia uniflora TaxID=39325 RepID=A0A7J7MQJ3_9MAGN|nr:hypothetical protein GIB67_039749 [Kingdonia uniflora]